MKLLSARLRHLHLIPTPIFRIRMTKTHENQDMSEYCDKYGWETVRAKKK